MVQQGNVQQGQRADLAFHKCDKAAETAAGLFLGRAWPHDFHRGQRAKLSKHFAELLLIHPRREVADVQISRGSIASVKRPSRPVTWGWRKCFHSHVDTPTTALGLLECSAGLPLALIPLDLLFEQLHVAQLFAAFLRR